MRSALWRILTLAFLVGLFDLPGHALNPFHASQALAATSAARQDPPAKLKRSHTSRVHMSPIALRLTTIQNLRTASSPGLTRLVLDLDAKARISKHPQRHAEGVTIEIPNAILSPFAKTKLATGRIAKPFIITQTSERSIEVSLPTSSFQSYKLLTLANPPRLVINVVPPSEPLTTPSVEPPPDLALPPPLLRSLLSREPSHLRPS